MLEACVYPEHGAGSSTMFGSGLPPSTNLISPPPLPSLPQPPVLPSQTHHASSCFRALLAPERPLLPIASRNAVIHMASSPHRSSSVALLDDLVRNSSFRLSLVALRLVVANWLRPSGPQLSTSLRSLQHPYPVNSRSSSFFLRKNIVVKAPW